MMRFLFALLLSFSSLFAFAGEGMWIPLLLKALNEAEMQGMGMKMTAEDIYSVNQGSLKDAIVHFGGFCTGEVISSSGLVLTNHHCGYGNIQKLSTIENNLLRDGFWAMNREAELPCPGLFVRFIVRIEDVSEAALAGVSDDMAPEERQSQIDQNINRVREGIDHEEYQDVFVRPFFKGNQYFAFVSVTYDDIRLVGTPPESIGKFGADTDNWEWPRHTGDFSMFRIYAGPDNLPAGYSADNRPYEPMHHLPISLDGVEEGDFSLVFGFPGSTDQYLPSYGVEYIAQTVDPARIAVRDRTLTIMDKHMRADEEVRLNYASRFASIANGWKKWIGERQGLERTNAVRQIQAFEQQFEDVLAADPQLDEKYGALLPAFEQHYQALAPYGEARTLYSEIFNRNIDLFRNVSRLNRAMVIFENNGEEAYRAYADAQIATFEEYFAAFRVDIDKEICHALLTYLMQDLDARFLPKSIRQEEMFMRGLTMDKLVDELYATALCSTAGVTELLSMEGAAFSEALRQLKAWQLLLEIQLKSAESVTPEYERLITGVNAMQRDYMKGLMEAFPEQRFWPDANSTLRVTYGLIEGYAPRDAIQYQPVTYLDGIIEKYVPGDYEFDIPDKLRELYLLKDYGQYTDRHTGKVPVCILGSNHTSGGNSGSPAIDAHGNLIGINFDRVWEGTMSDLFYDRSICRNIMVDIRYVLFVIDKFAEAEHLIDEMTLVHPKS